MLRAYEQWGERCVERFNGMWALALWDARRRRLFCSRDRFGIKPFVFRLEGDRFAFASEPRAFRRDPSFRARPNPAAIRDFLAQGHTDHREETFFAGDRQLPPGHALTSTRRAAPRRATGRSSRATRRQTRSDAFSELFSTRSACASAATCRSGRALSGGLDSSAVAVAIDHLLATENEHAGRSASGSRRSPPTSTMPAFDERPFAEAVVGRILSEPQWLTFDEQTLLDVLPDVVAAQGEPFGSTSIVAQWFVMRAAQRCRPEGDARRPGRRRGARRLPRRLRGYRLADLLAGGQLRQRGRRAALPSRSRAGAARRRCSRRSCRQRARWALRASGAAATCSSTVAAPANVAAAAPEAGRMPDRLTAQYHLILAQLRAARAARYEDRNSMAHSLEGRVPFLDHRLVEFSTA